MPPNSQNMPRAWHAPKGFLAHSLFTLACLYAIGERDLVAFWVFLEAHDGWIRFHERHRALLIPVMTMVSVSAFFISRSDGLSQQQGVVLATAVVFLTTSPPVPFADYTTPKAYFALSSAFVLSLAGVAFQLAFFGISHELPMRNLPEDELLNSRRGILAYLIYFRLPYLFLFFSLLFLTAGKYNPRHAITFSLSESEHYFSWL